MRTKLVGLFTALAFLFAFQSVVIAEGPATEETEAQEQLPKGPEGVVAVVNGTEITIEQLTLLIKHKIPQVTFHATISKRKYDRIKRESLTELVDEELFLIEAAKMHIGPAEGQIDAVIKEFRSRIPEGNSLEKILESSKMTITDLRDDLTRSSTITYYKETIENKFKAASKETVTDAYMKDYYDSNLHKFTEPEKLHISELLLAVDRSSLSKIWRKTHKEATELQRRIIDGEDFAEIAKEYSSDIYAAKGGDMGWAHKGSLSEEIEYAADRLEVGETSVPIRSLYGFHLVKLNDKKEAKLKPFDKINIARLRKELQEKEYNRHWDELKANLNDAAEIIYYAQ